MFIFPQSNNYGILVPGIKAHKVGFNQFFSSILQSTILGSVLLGIVSNTQKYHRPHNSINTFLNVLCIFFPCGTNWMILVFFPLHHSILFPCLPLQGKGHKTICFLNYKWVISLHMGFYYKIFYDN